MGCGHCFGLSGCLGHSGSHIDSHCKVANAIHGLEELLPVNYFITPRSAT